MENKKTNHFVSLYNEVSKQSDIEYFFPESSFIFLYDKNKNGLFYDKNNDNIVSIGSSLTLINNDVFTSNKMLMTHSDINNQVYVSNRKEGINITGNLFRINLTQLMQLDEFYETNPLKKDLVQNKGYYRIKIEVKNRSEKVYSAWIYVNNEFTSNFKSDTGRYYSNIILFRGKSK